MFKKIKELKLKVKIAIIAVAIIFVSSFVLAIFSTIRVIQLENMIEEHIQCSDISCDHKM